MAVQKKFKDWGKTRRFDDTDTVHEGKLLAYLQYELFVKGNHSTGKNEDKILSRETIEPNVNTLVHLYMVILVPLFGII